MAVDYFILSICILIVQHKTILPINGQIAANLESHACKMFVLTPQ